MKSVVNFFKNNPVLDAAFLSAATTIAASLAVRQGEVGVIAGALELVLATVARSQVTPNRKVNGLNPPTPVPTP